MCNTKHNANCNMTFGRPSKHDDCPRCNELKAGETPRVGWGIVRRQVNNRNSKPASSLDMYCFSVAIYHDRCTTVTNPSCACGKMSYTD